VHPAAWHSTPLTVASGCALTRSRVITSVASSAVRAHGSWLPPDARSVSRYRWFACAGVSGASESARIGFNVAGVESRDGSTGTGVVARSLRSIRAPSSPASQPAAARCDVCDAVSVASGGLELERSTWA
jgi:hypothetical protein